MYFSDIAVLLKHMNRPLTTVAIDGSLYRYHPKMHDLMMKCLQQLAPNNKVNHLNGSNQHYLITLLDFIRESKVHVSVFRTNLFVKCNLLKKINL